MFRKFQEGLFARPNSLAALANTGRPHPGARRSLAGAVQQAHRPGLAARSGPQPLSARQAVAVNQRNAKTEQAVRDMLHLLTVPYAAYQPGAPGRAPWQDTQDVFGQTWAATQVDHVWVYSHVINAKGDQEFAVVNPRTGYRVIFTPRGYYSGQFNGIASATGEFGRVYANTLGVIVVEATGGVALEAGAWGLAAEYAALYVTKEAVTGFGIRAGRDFGIQLVSGFITSKGSFWKRGKTSLANVNGSSILLAGILNTEGLELKLPAKLLMTAGTAAAGNLVTMIYANRKKHGSFVHGVDLHDQRERNDFLIGVGASGLLDVGTEFGTNILAPWVAPWVARSARGIIATSAGRAVPATLRAVRATRFVLPLSFGIGTVTETGKKAWEHNKEEKEEAEKRGKAAPRKSPGTGHHPKP